MNRSPSRRASPESLPTQIPPSRSGSPVRRRKSGRPSAVPYLRIRPFGSRRSSPWLPASQSVPRASTAILVPIKPASPALSIAIVNFPPASFPTPA